MNLFPGQFALRHPFWSPDESAGFEAPIVETAEDREPSPTAEPVRGEEETPEPEPAREETPEPESGEQSEDAPSGDDQSAAGAEGDDEAEPEAKRRDWGLKRKIDKQTARLKTVEQERDEAIARAKTLEELYAKPEGERTDGERESIRLQVRGEEAARVREEFRAQSLNKAADKLFDDGAKAFPNTWEKRVTELRDLFGEELGKRPDFLEAVTDLDNAPAVWHELGGDPESMDRLLSLPPVRLGVELARLSGRLAAPKPNPISKAPVPIKPLQDLAREDRPLADLINDPKADMREIDRRMAAHEKKQREARGR